MKLHGAVQNEAVLSNVGEIGEFRIRNSAKAFSILSSGLYANKIKAIIRELSCNAYDSHIAANKSTTPFDVHLPNTIEPWFSIRDYGIGLSHNQIINIYTTYFESTKTESNDFVGALGLGSKSPFSYTDNFTVTAIKDGRKGIYTAFINDQGVPSIALMMEETTEDPNGVEVRFAVESSYDFSRFKSEAAAVYEYFTLRPVISGCHNFQFTDPSYKDKDIIPGVHHLAGYGSYRTESFAIMGNIKYPIQIPNSEKVLGNLNPLLECGLVLEFAIGELDFQASREGLSYIPETIDAITKKLRSLNDQLTIHVATEANKFTNLWERANYLNQRYYERLFQQATIKYVTDTKFAMFDVGATHCYRKGFEIDAKELETKFNIELRAFSKHRSYEQCKTVTAKAHWTIPSTLETFFVVNDTKIGCTERAKNHWRQTKQTATDNTVFVIEAYDKRKQVDVAGFFKLLMQPTDSQILAASDLIEKNRKGSVGKNVKILVLEKRRRGRWNDEWVWVDAGNSSSFDTTKTYHYVEMSAWTPVNMPCDIKSLRGYLAGADIHTDKIYGVRKGDIEFIRTQSNWINLNTFVQEKLSNLDTGNVMGMVKQAIDFNNLYKYNVVNDVDVTSPYVKLYQVFKDVKADDSNARSCLESLCRVYKVTTQSNIDPKALIAKYQSEVDEMYKRYPLLKSLSGYSVDKKALIEYINLIDEKKGV